MESLGITEHLIEEMQSSWLALNYRRLYILFFWLIPGLIIGLIIGLNDGLVGVMNGLLLGGLTRSFINGPNEYIAPVQKLN